MYQPGDDPGQRKFASLCILSYKRPESLIRCLNSLHETIDYPCEIIVNCDAQDTAYGFVLEYWKETKISKVVLNNGQNRGVGRSFQNCLAIAEGEYIFKIDADITFHPHWLSQAIKVLQHNNDIGSIGLFDYHKWDPLDPRFKPEENVLEHTTLTDSHNQTIQYQIVKDFVSSIYGFRNKDLYAYSADGMIYEKVTTIPDDGLHQKFGTMALLDKTDNTAFGVGKSTYVSGTNEEPFKTPTFDKPLMFKVELPSVF